MPMHCASWDFKIISTYNWVAKKIVKEKKNRFNERHQLIFERLVRRSIYNTEKGNGHQLSTS